ncbi:hypothetical protein [Pengzhenrongella sp.]|uniref:hypothetical protein n=1 Tax=Pengzhenrongella sp. TaxID=2888820 RepID=UPI002F9332FF
MSMSGQLPHGDRAEAEQQMAADVEAFYAGGVPPLPVGVIEDGDTDRPDQQA